METKQRKHGWTEAQQLERPLNATCSVLGQSSCIACSIDERSHSLNEKHVSLMDPINRPFASSKQKILFLSNVPQYFSELFAGAFKQRLHMAVGALRSSGVSFSSTSPSKGPLKQSSSLSEFHVCTLQAGCSSYSMKTGRRLAGSGQLPKFSRVDKTIKEDWKSSVFLVDCVWNWLVCSTFQNTR